MSALWQVESPYAAEPLGGRASFGAIFDAQRDSLRFAHGSMNARNALEQAYDDRIDQVKRATGETLDNPLRFAVPFPGSADIAEAHLPENAKVFDDRLQQLAEKHPGADLGIGRSITDDAHRIMQQADPDFAEKFASAPGFGRWIATLAGGALESARDPVLGPLMLVGGVGENVAKTAIGRIAQMALREGAINAGSQAVAEPFVLASRRQAGLPAGLQEGASDVLSAGVFGTAFGLGGQVLGEGARRLFRSAPLAEAKSAAAVALDETIREGFAGRMAIGDRALRMMDEDIGAAVQSTLAKARASREATAAAGQAEIFGAGDPARVQRIAENFLTPEEAAPRPPSSLAQFLIDKGGVRDFQGELKALGLDSVSEQFRGKLVKPKGLELDRARELAAEAGYLGPPERAQNSTVPDLLNALEEEHRHGPVYSLHDQEAANAVSDFERTRVENEKVRGIVEKIDALAHKDIPDDMILRAAREAVEQGVEPFDALERVIMEDYRAGPVAADAPAPGMVRFYHGGQDPTSGGGRWATPDPIYARDFRATDGPNQVHYVDIPKNDPVALAARDESVSSEERFMNTELPEKWAKQLKPLPAASESHAADTFDPPDIAVPEPGMSDAALAAFAADQPDLETLEIPIGAALGEEGTEVHMRTLGDLLAEAHRGDELAALVAACNTEV